MKEEGDKDRKSHSPDSVSLPGEKFSGILHDLICTKIQPAAEVEGTDFAGRSCRPAIFFLFMNRMIVAGIPGKNSASEINVKIKSVSRVMNFYGNQVIE